MTEVTDSKRVSAAVEAKTVTVKAVRLKEFLNQKMDFQMNIFAYRKA